MKFDETKRHSVYLRDGYRCQYCGTHDATGHGALLSIDHIDSRASGGAAQNTKLSPATNLITACRTCNFAKQDKSPREWNAYVKDKQPPEGGIRVDWTKARAQATKRIDLVKGAQMAAAAKIARDSRKAAQGPSNAPAPAEGGGAAPHTGPGIQHGPDGKFQPGIAAARSRLAFARAIEASVDGQAPEAARLWRAGWNKTDKGDLNFTKQSAANVLAKFAERGNPLAFFYEHEDRLPLGERGGSPMKGACSAPSSVLTLRGPVDAPELWAEQIAWTAEAKRQIVSGERRQISPFAAFDQETREIVEILNVSLCAEGATHHGTLLASAGRNSGMDDMIDQVVEALEAGDFETAEAIIERMEAGEGGGEEMTRAAKMARAMVKYAKGKAAAQPPAPPTPEAPVATKRLAASRDIPSADVEAFNRERAEMRAATKRADEAVRSANRGTVMLALSRARDEGLAVDVIDEREHLAQANPEATQKFLASLGRKAKAGLLAASRDGVAPAKAAGETSTQQTTTVTTTGKRTLNPSERTLFESFNRSKDPKFHITEDEFLANSARHGFEKSNGAAGRA